MTDVEAGEQDFARLFKAWFFRIALLATGVIGFAIWIGDVVEIATYHFQGKPAMLERGSKATPPGEPVQLPDGAHRLLVVSFMTEANQRVSYERYVPQAIVDKLVAGERVPIVYLSDNPRAFIYGNEELPRGWGWLAAEIGGMAFFAWALRLR